MTATLTKKDLITLGYPNYTSENIIRQAKLIMVKKGYPFYNNKRLGRVPADVVESILGITLEMENNAYGHTNKN
ncbi:MAG: DUF3173 domain-containing protein [Enterococcus sp.]|uniref:DUF3173 domain-containing protein n=1 Tax=Enterococcus sp. TaxID=35783 RepID=UPI002FC81CEA